MPNPPSRLERVESDFLAALWRKEQVATYEMAIRYRQAVKALEPLWRDAYKRLQDAKAAGATADYLSGFIWSEYRLAEMLRQAADVFAAAGKDTGLILSRTMQESARLAAASAQRTIALELGGQARVPGGLHAGFVSFPQEQMLIITSRLGDNSPITDIGKRFGTDGPRIVRDELVKGLANAESPKLIASRMAKALGTHYGSTVVLARTETMRVYRDTTLATYKTNARLVKGWRWVAALQDSTCPVCWAMHGTEHDLSERMESHPACRCSMTPILRPWSEINPALAGLPSVPPMQTGVDAFAALPPERQRAILGPMVHEAYKRRLIALPDLVQRTHSPIWGGGLRQRPLNQLLPPGTMGTLRGKGGAGPLPKPSPPRTPLPPAPPKQSLITPTTAVVKVTEPPGPKGTPVGQGLDMTKVPKSGKIGNDIRLGLEQIEKVHGDGPLPGVPVSLDSSTKHHGVYGSGLAFGKNPDGSLRTFVTPKYLKVSRNADHAALTFVHEVGHYLDQQGVGVSSLHVGQPGYASTRSQNPLIAAWYRSVSRSRAYQSLEKMRTVPGKHQFLMPDGRVIDYTPQRNWLDYATTPQELWARTYAQYIATRSGHPRLIEQLNKQRDPLVNQAYHAQQWADDDFQPIAAAFDDIFRELGWLT